MRRVVIAGGSVAGLSAARELRRAGFDGTIQVVDRDPDAPYRRPSVSKGLLTGARSREDVATPLPPDLDVEQLAGVRLDALDLEAAVVHVRNGKASTALPFDGLVIATGRVARPWPGEPRLEGVTTLRSVADAYALRAALAESARLVIIGGGFIGLEVAASATALGVAATVVEAADVPLAHVLGTALGQRIADAHRERGVEILCGAGVASIDGHRRVERVVLTDGRILDADLVLVAIGSTPAVEWLAASGLDVAHGVRCDRGCAVEGRSRVVAAGDVAAWLNPLYDRVMCVEHWTHAIQQGTFAARRLLGCADPQGFSSAPYFWSDQFDLKLESYGSTAGHDQAHVVEDADDRAIVVYGAGGRLVAVAGLNAGRALLRYRRLVERRATIDEAMAAVAQQA